MQDALFPPDNDEVAPKPRAARTAPRTETAQAPRPVRTKPARQVGAAEPSEAHRLLTAALPEKARVGTSSWNYPGWSGLVWDDVYAETALSRHGLAAYARHPLFRTASLDRAFYRPLTAAQYAAYAAQVDDDFRFVVKAPALVTDATVRGEKGQALQPNPAFLDPELAIAEFALPALQGLGRKLGGLVFQISPLPGMLHARMPELLQRLARMLQALPQLTAEAPDAVVAVEVRDPVWLGPDLAAVLKASQATYCLGLHAKMPPIEGQLPMLRALWPGPLVCRWNLNRLHGAYGYEDAADRYVPYDKLVDEDMETRRALARVVRATAAAGYPAYVTISNKAEGSAPLSVEKLMLEIQAQAGSH